MNEYDTGEDGEKTKSNENGSNKKQTTLMASKYQI